MWQLLAGGVAAIALLAGTFYVGRTSGWDARDAKAQHELNATLKADAAQMQLAQANGFKIGAAFAGKTTEIRTRTEWMTRKVAEYVTPADDARAVLNVGFVRYHDAAAAGIYPAPVTATDAAPSGVALSTLADTLAGNYGLYHACAAQVIGLQDYVTAVTGYPASAPAHP